MRQGRRHPCLDGKVANKYDLANLHFITALSTHSIMPTPVSRSSTRPLQPQTIQRESSKTGSHKDGSFDWNVSPAKCKNARVVSQPGQFPYPAQGNSPTIEQRKSGKLSPIDTRSPGFIDIQSVSASVQSRRSHCPLVALPVPSLRQRPTRCHHDRPRKTASRHKGSPAPASSSCSGHEGEQST